MYGTAMKVMEIHILIIQTHDARGANCVPGRDGILSFISATTIIIIGIIRMKNVKTFIYVLNTIRFVL